MFLFARNSRARPGVASFRAASSLSRSASWPSCATGRPVDARPGATASRRCSVGTTPTGAVASTSSSPTPAPIAVVAASSPSRSGCCCSTSAASIRPRRCRLSCARSSPTAAWPRMRSRRPRSRACFARQDCRGACAPRGSPGCAGRPIIRARYGMATFAMAPRSTSAGRHARSGSTR